MCECAGCNRVVNPPRRWCERHEHRPLYCRYTPGEPPPTLRYPERVPDALTPDPHSGRRRAASSFLEK